MVEMMRKMGIGSYLPEVPSLCVGSCDLSPYEMITAYNTFPSRGVYVEPMFVTRIEDSMGNVIGEFNNHKREAVSEQTAYLMANRMEGVVNSGSGIRLRLKYGLKGEMAGKTGTTNDHSDGWFIGFSELDGGKGAAAAEVVDGGVFGNGEEPGPEEVFGVEAADALVGLAQALLADVLGVGGVGADALDVEAQLAGVAGG